MMALAPELQQTTVLTPKQRERAKTPQQRAEDVIYTLNHTFTCLSLTDFIVVPAIQALTGWDIGHSHAHEKPAPAAVSSGGTYYASSSAAPSPAAPPPAAAPAAASPKKGMFTGMLNSGEAQKMGCAVPGCDDLHVAGGGGAKASTASSYSHSASTASSAAAHVGHHHAPAELSFFGKLVWNIKHIPTTIKNLTWKTAGHWIAGEAIGDVGAALVTIPLQRCAPGMMDGIGRAMEPVVGGVFRRGAEHAAHKWGAKRGLDDDNQEVVAHAQELYRYEIKHLPQMGAWTVFSIGLHYGAMKLHLEKDITIGQFARMKAVGAGVTALTVFGARAAAPDKAHAWDRTAGKHVVVPLTKTVGRVFGVKEHDVDAYHARQNDDPNVTPQSWAARVTTAPPEPVVATARA
ncbi:MAG: hypothetical protein V4735_01230 [Pseudomonadota bacterium]